MIAKDRSWEELQVGDTASFDRTISEEDVRAFALLSGDENPLHTDEGYAGTTPFGKRVVHGMLLSSLLSQLVGMHLPGKRCLYVSQSLVFRMPVFVGEQVTVQGEITHRSEATHMLTIRTTIKNATSVVCVDGEAQVKVL